MTDSGTNDLWRMSEDASMNEALTDCMDLNKLRGPGSYSLF